MTRWRQGSDQRQGLGRRSRREHGVGAHVRAYVEEDVSFSEVKKKKAHIFEVVETATYVLRRAVHSTGYQEPGTICKRCGHRRSRVPFANGRSTHAPKGHLRIEDMTPDMAQNIEHSRAIPKAWWDYQRGPSALPPSQSKVIIALDAIRAAQIEPRQRHVIDRGNGRGTVVNDRTG
jgi:hypothetical protein